MLKAEAIEMLAELENCNTGLGVQMRTKYWATQPKSLIIAKLEFLTAPAEQHAAAAAAYAEARKQADAIETAKIRRRNHRRDGIIRR